MARPSKYDYSFLKKYNGISVIYAIYTEDEGVKYIGHSRNVYKRFYNHLLNHESEKNTKKYNWFSENKNKAKIKILSDNHLDWEQEEIKHISENSKNDLLNICIGGANNRIKKRFEDCTTEEHLLEINKSLLYLNRYYKRKGKEKQFSLLTKQEIYNISNGIFS